MFPLDSKFIYSQFPYPIDAYCVTVDTDWASEAALEKTRDLFKEFNAPSSWFLTHPTDVFQHENSGLFEFGIHPNLLYPDPRNTQGQTFEEVIEYLLNIVTAPKFVRSHALISSTTLLDDFAKLGFEADLSLFTSLQIIPPYRHTFHYSLVRLPYFWEDSFALYHKKLDLQNPVFHQRGVKIFNVHPVHVANKENPSIFNFLHDLLTFIEEETKLESVSSLVATFHYYEELEKKAQKWPKVETTSISYPNELGEKQTVDIPIKNNRGV